MNTAQSERAREQDRIEEWWQKIPESLRPLAVSQANDDSVAKWMRISLQAAGFDLVPVAFDPTGTDGSPRFYVPPAVRDFLVGQREPPAGTT